MKGIVAAALATGAALVAAAAAEAAEVTFPRVDTARVADADDGTPATGASWRQWPIADPSQLTSSRVDQAVGTVREGAVWAGTEPSSASVLGTDRVLAVEKTQPDAAAPDGTTGWFAVLRTSAGTRFSILEPAQLVRVATPTTVVEGSTIRVRIAPAVSLGTSLTSAHGLQGWAVLRSPEGAGRWAEVGTVAASAVEVELVDSPPAGSWVHAVRPVFSGHVRGLVSSLPSQAVTIAGVACAEPSALDRDPSAPPLLARAAAERVALTWEPVPAATFDVYRGTIAALRSGVDDARPAGACAVSAPSVEIDAATGDWFVVAARCGATLSSLGRRSDGMERGGPATRCP